MRKIFIKLLVLSIFIGFFSKAFCAEKQLNIGIVDFAKCITESKYGKTEQENFETLRIQMQKAIEDLDSQMSDTAKKLQDPDLLDSMNAETEKEMKFKLNSLGEELNRYQNQYYQVMQQANMKIIQTMSELVNQASEAVAKKEKLSLIVRSDAAFHYLPTLDITEQIINELEKKFEKDKANADASKQKDSSPQAETASNLG